jgi:hypothetical protein
VARLDFALAFYWGPELPPTPGTPPMQTVFRGHHYPPSAPVSNPAFWLGLLTIGLLAGTAPAMVAVALLLR